MTTPTEALPPEAVALGNAMGAALPTVTQTWAESGVLVLEALSSSGWSLVRTEDADDPCPHCDVEHVWPCPTIPRCDEPRCKKMVTCGFPTDNGYRQTCGDHYPGRPT